MRRERVCGRRVGGGGRDGSRGGGGKDWERSFLNS